MKPKNKITRIYCDFDDTIVQSGKQVAKMICDKYGVDMKKSNYHRWDFKDVYPVKSGDIWDMFESDEFFENVEFIENAKESILALGKEYEIAFVTIGTIENLRKKEKFLEKHFSDIKYIFIGLPHYAHTKENIDMSDGIFIDDRADYLRSSNANIKILMKNFKNYTWQFLQPNENIYMANTWEEISDIVNFFKEFDVEDDVDE